MRLFNKILLALLLLAGSIPASHAQIDSIQYTLDNLFSGLDRSKLSTNMLADKTLQFVDLSVYNDTSGSGMKKQDWDLVYATLRNSLWNPGFWPDSKAMNDTLRNSFRDGITPVALIIARYNELSDSIIEKGLFDTVGGQLVEGPNFSPAAAYLEREMVAVFCPDANTFNLHPVYKFNAANTYSNLPPGDVQLIEADFNDGIGWRTVTPGDTIQVHYTSYAARSISVRVTLSGSGSSLRTIKTKTYADKKEWTKKDEQSYHKTGSFEQPDATLFVLSNKLDALLSIEYGLDASGNKKSSITKPFVIVEGIDFPDPKMPEYKSNYQVCGELGLFNFLNGIEFDFSTGQSKPWEPIVLAPELLRQLNARGFDIVYVDFANNNQSMKNNGEVLIAALKQLKNEHPLAENIVLCGASMGGQISRYALSKMERDGIDHCVRLYLSFDSPNLGANIPMGMQEFLQQLNTMVTTGIIEHNLANLNTVAAKELLLHHYTANGGITQERTDWLRELEAVGSYPKFCRKAAIVNGSTGGFNQGYSEGDRLFRLKASQSIIKVPLRLLVPHRFKDQAFHIYAARGKDLPGGTDNCIFSHQPGLIGPEIARATLSDDFPDIDAQCGGGYSLQTLAMDAAGISLSVDQRYFNFIPVRSSLAMEQAGIADDAGSLWPDPTRKSPYSPFDEYYGQAESNQAHVCITHQNIAWLMDLLDRTESSHPQHLPFLVNNTNYQVYNYGLPSDSRLHSCEINNTAKVQVNGGYWAGYKDYFYLPENGSTHTVQSFDCTPAIIRVNTGGIFEIGDGTAGNNGVAILKKGSRLIIRQNGRLNIRNTSRLILEDGATLEVEDGALIELSSTESVIEFRKGSKLIIAANASFHFTGNGYLFFRENNGTPNITGVNARFIIQGPVNGQKKLEIEGSNAFVSSADLAMVSIKNCSINMKQRAEMKINGTCDLEDLHISSQQSGASRDTHKGITLTGKAKNIRNLKVEHGSPGLHFPNYNAVPDYKIVSCTFENNDIGVLFNGQSIHIEESAFNNNRNPIIGEMVTGPGSLRWSTFNRNDNAIRVELLGNQDYYLVGNNIQQTNGFGVDVTEGNLFLKCNIIRNCMLGAVRSGFHNWLLAGSEQSQGYNSFLRNNPSEYGGNGKSILCDMSERIELKNGYNAFQAEGTFPVQGKLDTRYYSVVQAQKIDLDNNFWGSPLTLVAPPRFIPYTLTPGPDSYLPGYQPFLSLSREYWVNTSRYDQLKFTANGNTLSSDPQAWNSGPGQFPVCSRMTVGSGFTWTLSPPPVVLVNPGQPPVVGGGGEPWNPGGQPTSPVMLSWNEGYNLFQQGNTVSAFMVFSNLLSGPYVDAAFLATSHGKTLLLNYNTVLGKAINDSLLTGSLLSQVNSTYTALINKLILGGMPEQAADIAWKKSALSYSTRDLNAARQDALQAHGLSSDTRLRQHIGVWNSYLLKAEQRALGNDTDTVIARFAYNDPTGLSIPAIASPSSLCLMPGQTATVSSNLLLGSRWFVMPYADTINLSAPLSLYATSGNIQVSNIFGGRGTIFLLYGTDPNGVSSVDVVKVTSCGGPLLPDPVITGGNTLQAPQVYPNPFRTDFQVLLPEGWEGSSATLSDAAGRVLQEKALDHRSGSLHTENLVPGNYLLQLRNANGETRSFNLMRY